MTSSTAEVMKGGWMLAEMATEGRREREGTGDSSSWKARSTERRRKKVAKVLKGSRRVLETFLGRALVVRKGGGFRGVLEGEESSGVVLGCVRVSDESCGGKDI